MGSQSPKRRREAWPATPAVCSSHPWQDHLQLPFFLHSHFPCSGLRPAYGERPRLGCPSLGLCSLCSSLGCQIPTWPCPEVPALPRSLRLAFRCEIASPHLLPAHPLLVLSPVPRNPAGLSSVIACAPWLAHTDVLKAHLRPYIPLSCIRSVGPNSSFAVWLGIQ